MCESGVGSSLLLINGILRENEACKYDDMFRNQKLSKYYIKATQIRSSNIYWVPAMLIALNDETPENVNTSITHSV